MIEWKPFLGRWSQQLMRTKLADYVGYREPIGLPDWLGYPPATADEVAQMEERLRIQLPPSFRSFLSISNGWGRTTSFMLGIRPTSEVDWLRVEQDDFMDDWAAHRSVLDDLTYYRYRDEGADDYRGEHVSSLLVISGLGDGFYLLNPDVMTPDGEWEAWLFAERVNGVRRYPTFAHLMRGEYRAFAESEGIPEADSALPNLTVPAPDVPRIAAARRTPSVESLRLKELIETMSSADDALRANAVQTFNIRLDRAVPTRRRPDLIAPLTELYYQSGDAAVRAACIRALTVFAYGTQAPAPLFESLSDPDPEVVLQGVRALTNYPDARAVEPLCKFVESRVKGSYYCNVFFSLGEMQDERAIPTLAKVLNDIETTTDCDFHTASVALGRCGPKSFEPLVAALSHRDPQVRLRAIIGLDFSLDPRAGEYLDRMKSDPDREVRERAGVRMGKFWHKVNAIYFGKSMPYDDTGQSGN